MSSRRITTIDPIPPVPLRFLGDEPRQRPDYAVVARAALAVGGLVFAGLLTVTLFLFYLFQPLVKFWIGFTLFDLTIGALTGCAYGVRWIYTTVTRPWSIEDEERWRRYNQEDEDRSQATAPDAAPPTRAERIENVVRLILDRHYLDRQKTDRVTMESAGLVTQPEWNSAYALLQAAKIKSAKGFLFESYPEAIAAYRAAVKITSGALWTTSDQGKTWTRFELT